MVPPPDDLADDLADDGCTLLVFNFEQLLSSGLLIWFLCSICSSPCFMVTGLTSGSVCKLCSSIEDSDSTAVDVDGFLGLWDENVDISCLLENGATNARSIYFAFIHASRTDLNSYWNKNEIYNWSTSTTTKTQQLDFLQTNVSKHQLKHDTEIKHCVDSIKTSCYYKTIPWNWNINALRPLLWTEMNKETEWWKYNPEATLCWAK